jgi:hypothetical protein
VDLQGCEWGFATLDDPVVAAILTRCVVRFMAIPEQGLPNLLGSGFIVTTQDGFAVCMTAAHVLDAAHGALGLPPARGRSAAPGFEILDLDGGLKGPCSRRRVLVHVEDAGNNDMASITEAVWDRGLDTALVTLSSPLFKAGQRGLAINSDLHPPGTAVIGVGVQETRVTDRGEYQTGRLIGIETGLEARYGTIRQRAARGLLANAPVYELTLPIPHGMSGGPILLAPQEGSTIQAIAFASSDHAEAKTVNDCATPGAGTAISLMSAYALAHKSGNRIHLKDFAHRGAVRDVGEGWKKLEEVEIDGEPYLKVPGGLILK